jgi:hypothetical protein
VSPVDAHLWPWVTLLFLGGLHGINPGMGWLFAVALGLQGGEGRAVWRALPPLALGHAFAIGTVAALALLVGVVVPPAALKWAVAVLLLSMGGYRLLRARHPRYGGMKVGARDLTVWSFLMASAHGAGLMVLPVLLGMASAGNDAAMRMPAMGAGGATVHGAHGALLAGVSAGQAMGLMATAVHTAGYLLVTALVALLVYHRFGVRLLRTHWINLDLIWALALVLTALATPLL